MECWMDCDLVKLTVRLMARQMDRYLVQPTKLDSLMVQMKDKNFRWDFQMVKNLGHQRG
jgi:hypothetical protein